MTWTTPKLEIPYAEDGDPRALLPATMEAQSERIEELIETYAASGLCLGGTADAGAYDVIPFGPGIEPGQPWAYAAGVFTYSGPNRRFLVTLTVTFTNGAGLLSQCGIGTAAGLVDRESIQSSGVGPDGQATHTHTVILVAMLGPDFVTTLAGNVAANTAVPFDARFEAVSL